MRNILHEKTERIKKLSNMRQLCIQNPQPSLNDIDKKLEKYLDFTGGFFVELGGNDGYKQSNTFYLESMKQWKGILIEAIPELYVKCVNNRPFSNVFNYAIVSESYSQKTVTMRYSGLMSFVSGAMKNKDADDDFLQRGLACQNIKKSYDIEVPARTLNSIFIETNVKHIDFLSVDVEGYEANVLRGIDFSMFKPEFILVEARFRAEVEKILLPFYTICEEMSDMDVLYKCKSNNTKSYNFAKADCKTITQGGYMPASSNTVNERMRQPMHILSRYQNLLGTMQSKKAEAADGTPVPWYTFPAIEFFKGWDVSGLNIFEYSCGNSSLFWARKGANIWSVEDNKDWYNTVIQNSSDMRSLLLRENREQYVNAIEEAGEVFDIVIIDGKWRSHCAKKIFDFLKPNGVIILDNSDWWKDVGSEIQSRGFFEISFSGFGPINAYCWTTSLFLPFCKHVLENRTSSPLPIGGIEAKPHDKW